MSYLVVNICADTTANAETLTALLAGKPNEVGFEFCDLSQNDTFDAYKTHINQAEVYIVGHGSLGKEEVVDEQDRGIVNIAEIMQWCTKYGAAAVIDTCCYPEQRLAKVKALNLKTPYHCKQDLKKPVTPGICKNDTVPGFLATQGIKQMYP
ncbi:hypothetical protein [Methylomonas koyamae]|uniref:Uncharacterized protein n=1 Tax=Methylomonas koyamae TaxID=702114 RepID=A0AA91DC81_9GAMM|nr:hypothetical protein [Methylomonas koyamae]OAI25864.1 hypothetical protein A1356_12465 [Methylomonas koyamae]